MRKWFLALSFCFAALCASAHEDVVYVTSTCENFRDTTLTSRDIVFNFKFKKTDFDIDYMLNAKALEEIDTIFINKSLNALDTLKIIGTASPNGKYAYNKALANKRALSIKQMLLDRYVSLRGVVIIIDFYVSDWSKLKERAKHDFDLPHRETVINTLNLDRNLGTIGWLLMRIGDGESWRYIIKNKKEYLRVSDVTARTIRKKQPAEINKEVPLILDSLRNDEKVQAVAEILTPLAAASTCRLNEMPRRKAFLAIKTNLLFDALSLVNMEVEVPINNRFSVAGECILPWWTWDNGKEDSKRNKIQLFNANIEGRYWFGKRAERPVMTGWFAGVYAGGGLYDFEYKTNGYQGEFFIMGGLSGGYAHTINKKGNLRIEYSLGVGYMQTDYRHYESHFAPTNVWHPLYKEGGAYSWFGPTKAKVSLVWVLNKRGRGR